jgi:hypothetical protein
MPAVIVKMTFYSIEKEIDINNFYKISRQPKPKMILHKFPTFSAKAKRQHKMQLINRDSKKYSALLT